jgi:hypothetical protein
MMHKLMTPGKKIPSSQVLRPACVSISSVYDSRNTYVMMLIIHSARKAVWLSSLSMKYKATRAAEASRSVTGKRKTENQIAPKPMLPRRCVRLGLNHTFLNAR